MTDPEKTELRKAFSAFMTGVTVVTTGSDDGNMVGFTANSFTSVSLDPPMLLVCCGNQLSCLPVFNRNQRFAINILSEFQQDVSDRFARFQGDRFDGINWHLSKLGNPLIAETSAWFDCRLRQAVDAGDHVILIGEVEGYHHKDVPGLGFYRGGYFKPGLERLAAEVQASANRVRLGAIIEDAGSILLLPDAHEALRLPSVGNSGEPGTQKRLKEHLVSNGIEVEFGPIYSIFENEATGDHSIYYRASAISLRPELKDHLVPVSALTTMRFTDPVVESMLHRYAKESSERLFGVYYGTDKDGQVEKLAPATPDRIPSN